MLNMVTFLNSLLALSAFKTNHLLSMTDFDLESPEDLWIWLSNFESKTGDSTQAIPHNSNIPNKMMFHTTFFENPPLTNEFAMFRNKCEVLFEVTQGKVTTEALPTLLPNDEFANFKKWDAMKRKESYSLIWPCFILGFLRGFDYSLEDMNGNFMINGYKKDVAITPQERAFPSPILYNPN